MSKCSNVRATPDDIPLRSAVVAARGVCQKVYPKAVKVFPFPMPQVECRYYDFDYGAGTSEFRNGNTEERLQLLLKVKRELIEQHGFGEEAVHKALSVIPAYRRAMQPGAPR